MNTDLVAYYRDRAKEYENIYRKPERQDDLKRGATILQDTFMDKDILEVCCGTGYWTEKIAGTASSIYATDINESVMEIARHKQYEKANVTFGIADIYSYTKTKNYEGLFGGFIWSHIQIQDLKKFLTKMNSYVLPEGTIAFM